MRLISGWYGSKYEIFYFIIHFGVINVIGIVDPAQKVHLPADCFIQEAGGVQHIPDNQGRNKVMPRGLWTFFEQQAVEIETEYIQMSLSRLNWQEDNVLTEPPEELVNMFGFVPSYLKDVKDQGRIVHGASIANLEKTLNFLPEGFQLHHRENQRSVFVPENHKLILHHTTSNTSGTSYTLFLAVGNEGIFTFSKLYIICHTFKHGLQSHSAFFVNVDTFQAEDFLPDANPKILVKDIDSFIQIREALPTLLKRILTSKGIYNLKYILRRIQFRYDHNA